LSTETNGSILNWFALYAVTREKGEPRTDTRCLTKTRIKNRQTTVGQFVSYTIYSRLGGFSFFPVKHRKEVTENTSAAATMPLPSKKDQQNASHSHTHMYLVQNRVLFHLGKRSSFTSRILKQQTISWGQSGKLSSEAPSPEVLGKTTSEEFGAFSSSEATQTSALLTCLLQERDIPTNFTRPLPLAHSSENGNKTKTKPKNTNAKIETQLFTHYSKEKGACCTQGFIHQLRLSN